MPTDSASQRIALGQQVHELSWLTDTHAGQAVLAETYRNEQRPRCLCVSPGIEMYVARRGDTYYLARMPGTGMLHDERCSSFERINLYSGASGYASGVIVESALGKSTVLFRSQLERQLGAVAMGVDGLLDLLLDTANLNRWSPDEPKRTWESVSTALRGAAASIVLKGHGSLDRLLLVPTPYEKASHEDTERQQIEFLTSDDIRFVLAPLRELKPTNFGWRLQLKHMPNTLFWLKKPTGTRLAAQSGGTFDVDAATFPALCLAIVRRTKGEGFAVEELALRRTDRRFLPCLSEAEAAAAEQLADRGIPHLRPLRYDMPFDLVLCDFALTGQSTLPTPVFVLAPSGNVALDEEKRATARVLSTSQVPILRVEGGTFSPALPAAQQRAATG